MQKTMIGILAGMGPRSTAPFVDLVMDACQTLYGAQYDEDFPPVMIYSLPTPFYIDKPINHRLMKDVIIEGLLKLQAAGADFVAMPCNSAHVYFDELAAALHIPLLNIVTETTGCLPDSPAQVTLFATGTTFESGIYQQGITAAGHRFVFRENWQTSINTLVKGIKADKTNPENSRMWHKLLQEAGKEAVDTIIVACTDLNAVLGSEKGEIPIIDSAKCLAHATVRKYLALQSKA